MSLIGLRPISVGWRPVTVDLRLPSWRVKEHAAGRHDRPSTGEPGAMTEGRLAPDEVRTRTFTRVVRGYKRREVRRLLERAATDLVRLRNGITTGDPGEQLPLTPEEVEEARFQPSLGGYEMDEVDEFLDLLVVELERAAHEPLRPPSALPARPPPPWPVPSSPPPRRPRRGPGRGGAGPGHRGPHRPRGAHRGPDVGSRGRPGRRAR